MSIRKAPRLIEYIAKCGCLGNETTRLEQWDPIALKELPEISSMTAGQIHCGAITKKGKIYMWGSNDKGQLGLKLTEKIINKPRLLNAFAKKKIISIALGKYHSIALTQSFDVYSWGSNENGQLGISMPMFFLMQKNEQIYTPTLVRSLIDKGIFKIACGKKHSCGLSLTGLLYTWGDNRKGQLGHQLELQTQGVPMIVKALTNKPLTNVFAGYNCTIMAQDFEGNVNRNQQFFDLWKTVTFSENRKDIKKLPENEITSKNTKGLKEAEKVKRGSPGRKRVELDAPILVTNTEKIYRFRRCKGDDTCVTIFTDKISNNTEDKMKKLYEKFWLQNHPSYKPKNYGEIFFGDKDPDELID